MYDEGRGAVSYPLEPDREQMAGLGQAAVEFVANFIGNLESAPANGLRAGESLDDLMMDAPQDSPSDFDVLLKTFGEAAGNAVETAGPRYAAYIPGGGLFTSALADFLARGVNRYTGLSGLAPGLVAMEESVIRWACDQFRLPAAAGGLVTSGGSLSTLAALVAARHHHLGEDFADGTLYITAHTHHCVAKAARIAGFPGARVRIVPVTDDLRLDVAAAARMISADRALGLRPFFLVASAGTTDTGTVDPITEIAQVTARENLWLHVDGAYGGFFQFTERGRAALAGIDRADSIVVDPHKSLFLPYGTGILLVRDTGLLRGAYFGEGHGHYQQDAAGGQVLPDYSALGPELTREFRGLRLWLPLHLHGVGAFRDALDEKLDLAAHAYADLAADARLQLPWKPDLSTVVFGLAGGDDDANRRFLDRINASGKAFLSSTRIRGRIVLRLCILSHRIHHGHLEQVLDVIHAAAREVPDLSRAAETCGAGGRRLG